VSAAPKKVLAYIDPPPYMLREVAARHQLDPRTLIRAYRGEAIRGAAVMGRAEVAVTEMRKLMARKGKV
jgi:hypothetical protein